MGELAWRASAPPNPTEENLAVLSYLPLKSFWALAEFNDYTWRSQRRLKSAGGLVGYSLLAQFLAKRFRTRSI